MTARRDTPPSIHAMSVLKTAARTPFPCQETNSGVVDKLVAVGYAERRQGVSPYRSHTPGTKIDFLHVTEAGHIALAAMGAI